MRRRLGRFLDSRPVQAVIVVLFFVAWAAFTYGMSWMGESP